MTIPKTIVNPNKNIAPINDSKKQQPLHILVGNKELETSEPMYKVQVSCQNCNDERFYAIEMGTTKLSALEHTKCKKCGCNIVVDFRKKRSHDDVWSERKKKKGDLIDKEYDEK